MITNKLAETYHNLGLHGAPRDCGRHRFVKGSVVRWSELPLSAGVRKLRVPRLPGVLCLIEALPCDAVAIP